MSTRIDVVNFALGMLGESALTSVEDDSDKARAIKVFYPIARDATLEDGDWTFATKRFRPAKSSTAPDWGWSSAFPLPSDIIRLTRVDRNWTGVIGLSDQQQDRNPVDHVVENREILCNEDEIYCLGVRRVEDEGIYSPLFVEAFAAHLAYLAALPITESNQKQQAMLNLYVGLIGRAKTRDGQQSTTRRIRHRTLSNAR